MHRLVLVLSLAFAVAFALAACSDSTPSPDAVTDSTATAAEIPVPIDTTLFDSLRAIEATTGGRLGFAALHLESGWRTVYRGDETFPMASVAKLPMALAFLREVDAGRFRLDSVVRLSRADHRPGRSIAYARAMKDSGRTTLHALLEVMMVESDNTAADYLLRLAGGPAAADSMMRTLGLESIDITSYEGELIMRWAGVEPPAGAGRTMTRDEMYAQIEAAGKSAWEAAEARLTDNPMDAAPPEPVARLLSMLQEGRILQRATTDTLLAIMQRATTGKNRIPGMLPSGTPVAHKTGSIASVANDVGIVTLPNGEHLAVVAFVKGSRVAVPQRDRAIARAAALAYGAVTTGPPQRTTDN